MGGGGVALVHRERALSYWTICPTGRPNICCIKPWWGVADFARSPLGLHGKAVREAKEQTSWLEPNTAFEAALETFIRVAGRRPGIHADLERFIAPLLTPARWNSLALKLFKLDAPGVPDFYQGIELGTLGWWIRIIADRLITRSAASTARPDAASRCPAGFGSAWKTACQNYGPFATACAVAARVSRRFDQAGKYHAAVAMGPRPTRSWRFSVATTSWFCAASRDETRWQLGRHCTLDLPPELGATNFTGDSSAGWQRRDRRSFETFPVLS